MVVVGGVCWWVSAGLLAELDALIARIEGLAAAAKQTADIANLAHARGMLTVRV